MKDDRLILLPMYAETFGAFLQEMYEIDQLHLYKKKC